VVPDHIVIENTSTWSTREIDWHYYASPDASEFTLYDDDGSSKSALATNKYELIKVKCKPVAGGCNFEFSSNGGGFPGKPAGRNFHLILHGMAGSLIAVSKDGQITTSRINENGDPAFDFVFGGKAELGIVKIKRGIE
jgi:hypothetical protein